MVQLRRRSTQAAKKKTAGALRGPRVSRFGGQGRETEDVALAKCIEDPLWCVGKELGKWGGGSGVFGGRLFPS